MENLNEHNTTNLVNPFPSSVGVHFDGQLPPTDYQVTKDLLTNGLPGAQYIPAQYDNAWTHVKEVLGQLDGVTNYLTRAIYPGDINGRAEIALQVIPEVLEQVFNKDNPGDGKRWKPLKVEYL